MLSVDSETKQLWEDVILIFILQVYKLVEFQAFWAQYVCLLCWKMFCYNFVNATSISYE